VNLNDKTDNPTSMQGLPLVTIVTPSFNAAPFIEEAIASVARQTYSRIEHIVVDGGSTDGTAEIIERHSSELALWLSEPDDGQADALRKGFQMSSGTVLAWINADDVYPDDAVASAVMALTERRSDVVYGNRGLIDGDGARIGERKLTPFLPYFSRQGMMYGGFGVYQPAAFWTRDLYFDVGGVDPTFRFAMDTDLFVKFARAEAKFTFLPRELVLFRVHEASKTSTAKDTAQADWRRISESVPSRPAVYKWAVRLICRAWKVAYHLKTNGGKYLVYRFRDRRYRFVP